MTILQEVCLDATVQIIKRNEVHLFKVIPKRRVKGRPFAWLDKCRRLWKNCKRRLNASLQFVILSFLRLLLLGLQTSSYRFPVEMERNPPKVHNPVAGSPELRIKHIMRIGAKHILMRAISMKHPRTSRKRRVATRDVARSLMLRSIFAGCGIFPHGLPQSTFGTSDCIFQFLQAWKHPGDLEIKKE